MKLRSTGEYIRVSITMCVSLFIIVYILACNCVLLVSYASPSPLYVYSRYRLNHTKQKNIQIYKLQVEQKILNLKLSRD